jgi:ATP-dependent Clp protease protease subunit
MPIQNAVHHPRHPYPPEPPHRPNPPAQPPLPPSGGPVLHSTAVPSAADPVLDRLLEERIIFLGREVDDEIANRISAQLLLLAAQDPERDITMYINSPGGSVTAGMAIYDTMRLIRPDVATWAVGFAASMGQFLLTAGAAGKRHALPHARILMHQPSAGIGGQATDIAIRAGVYSQMKVEIAEITARHTGQTFETITADSDRDRWFTAPEAQAYGLVDHVVTD